MAIEAFAGFATLYGERVGGGWRHRGILAVQALPKRSEELAYEVNREKGRRAPGTPPCATSGGLRVYA